MSWDKISMYFGFQQVKINENVIPCAKIPVYLYDGLRVKIMNAGKYNWPYAFRNFVRKYHPMAY